MNTQQKVNDAAADGFMTGVNLSTLTPGATFEARWMFRNSGSASWDGRYQFVYTGKPLPQTEGYALSALGDKTAWPIGEVGATGVISPGGVAQLTLKFRAPAQPGNFATTWQLQAPDGTRFGPVRWLRLTVLAEQVTAPSATLSYQTLSFENSSGNAQNMLPGQQFSGRWVLKNSGTAAWTEGFRLAFHGEPIPDTKQFVPQAMGSATTIGLKDLTGQRRVEPGGSATFTVNLVAPQQPGAYAYHWQLEDENGRAFGGIRWLTINVVGATIEPPPQPETAVFQPGMNLNPEVHGLDLERLAGLAWVRYPFFASRLKLTPEEAYQQRYRHLIQSYAAAKTKSLLVLHQDTYWGNAPWDNGDWESYATAFAQMCGRVANVCSEFGSMVAYQIFNEQDSGPSNPSAIGLPAEKYAIILQKAAAAIRQAHPGAMVVIGGLNSGPEAAVSYLRTVEKSLGSSLPVDALAYHPYGRYVQTDAFYNKQFGKLRDALNTFKKAYPKLPLWLTEFGIPGHAHEIGPERYADIAQYLREVVDELTGQFTSYVPVAIWFAWTDHMENAGIIRKNGELKAHIKEAYQYMIARGAAPPTAKSVSFEAISDAKFLHFNTTLANFNAVPAESTFTYRWTFQNSGESTWGDGFQLVYAPGDSQFNEPMAAKSRYALAEIAAPLPAAPGAEVTITLDMTAPALAGRRYQSRWELRDPQDKMFGYFYAEITVVPAPTAGTSVREPKMTFIKDQTIKDGTRITVGDNFEKQWLVKNTGSRHWGSGFRLVFVEGDLRMARGTASHMVPDAKPGDTVILSVPMTAPPTANGQPTTYKSMWRLQDDRGNFFGDPVWANIVSLSGESPTADTTTPATSPTGGQTPLTRLINNPSIWYSQKDPQWADNRLGFGSETIGSWGCLMTCMSMALTAHGFAYTPAQFNEKAKATGNFFSNSSAIKFVAPAIHGLAFGKNVSSWPQHTDKNKVWTGEDPIQRIDKALARGHIVVAQVDYAPTNGVYDQHWVIIVQRTPDGSDYLIIDPYTLPQHRDTQPFSLMNKYGRPNPAHSHETNLRHAIISTMVYHIPGGSGG